MPELRRIAPELACQVLQGIERLDPTGLTTPADVLRTCRAGECLVMDTEDGGRCVVVLVERRDMTWVEFAVGAGGHVLSHQLDDELRARGSRAVAFQTARRGLVRRAERRGYQVVGWVLRKEL